MDPVQERLPETLPLSGLVPVELLARRKRWGLSYGAGTWCLLPGMLLVIDVVVICGRGDEPFMRSRDYGFCIDRKGFAAGPRNRSGGRRYVGLVWNYHAYRQLTVPMCEDRSVSEQL